MSAALPPGVAPYKRTPTFTEATVPAGLLHDHSTKEGTWGLIHVEEGRLKYLVTDPAKPPEETILVPDAPPGVVEPLILHRVEPLGAVRFHVEFFRHAGR